MQPFFIFILHFGQLYFRFLLLHGGFVAKPTSTVPIISCHLHVVCIDQRYFPVSSRFSSLSRPTELH